MDTRKALVETVYSSESYLAGPSAMLGWMRRDLRDSRGLAWRLMTRDLSVRYRQSLLGFLWALAVPVFTAAMLTLAAEARLVNAGNVGIPYPAYVLLGMVLWQSFADALNAPAQAVHGAKTLLARVKFPYEALILAKLGEAAFDLSIKLVLVLGAFLWFGVPVGWPALLLAPFALLDLMMLGLFLGLFLAPLAVLFEDVSRALGLATAVWFWITPVAYGAPQEGAFAAIVRLNPVTPLLSTTRDLAIGNTMPIAPGFWVVTGIALFGALVAWAAFRLAMPFVIERVSH